MNNFERRYVYGEKKLLDSLLDFKINSEEFMKNKQVVNTIGSIVQDLKKRGKEKGYILLSVVSGLQRKIILVMCSHYHSYTIRSWIKKEQIEKPFEIMVHENSDKDLYQFTSTICQNHNINQEVVLNAMLTESLTGYVINKSKAIDLVKLLQKDDKSIKLPREDEEIQERLQLGEKVMKTIEKEMDSVEKKIVRFSESLKCPELYICITTPNKNQMVTIGKIKEVKELNNRRYYLVEVFNYRKGKEVEINYVVSSSSAGVKGSDADVKSIEKCYTIRSRWRDYFDTEVLRHIPYNLIDKDRLIVGTIDENGFQHTIIGPDPKVESNAKELLEDRAIKQAKLTIQSLSDISTSEINDDKFYIHGYKEYERQAMIENPAITPLGLKLKALKKMTDEYKYLAKKTKASGKDVMITDKIKYNHDEGKVTYNDFSIAVDDELVKSTLYSQFTNYLTAYYRKEKEEQEILDSILDSVFRCLKSRLNQRYKKSYTINMRINNSIDLKIEGKLSSNSVLLMYLNDQRFNKNEILEVIREITCYRSQQEADTFIKNIGRLGLSVYIGITSGYEVEYPKTRYHNKYNRIFRFRKLKGRSNYELILDNTNIPLKGKKLISILYKAFNNEYVHNFHNKIDNYIFDTCDNTGNYLQYKFLIDSSYTKFKDKAKAFLDKKVEDTQSEYVKYFNKKSRKTMEAIKVTGLSGNIYIIAYNENDSFVFLNPVRKDDVYEDGKYICMIDQSNIKSNIGFDTVVSKLMSLKNDSSIAHTIYNLEEELNG